MAIFIASTKSISRGKGQSAVASASYRAGVELQDERYGKKHDYSNRFGVMSADIILPSSLKNQNVSIERGELWNKAEKAENRKDARVAREWLVNLPYELDEQQRKELAHQFSQELADRYGVIADCAIHKPTEKEIERGADARNFHAHIMLTTRKAELNDNNEIVLTDKSTAELSDKKRHELKLERMSHEVKEVRQLWESVANKKLAEHDLNLIDSRSYKSQGIDIEPQLKMGSVATKLERRKYAEELKKAKEAEAKGEHYEIDKSPATKLGVINEIINERNELIFNRELKENEIINNRAERIIFESRKNNEREQKNDRLRTAIERASEFTNTTERNINITNKRVEHTKQQLAKTEQQTERAERAINSTDRTATPSPFDEQYRASVNRRKQATARLAEQERRIAEETRRADKDAYFYKRTDERRFEAIELIKRKLAHKLLSREKDELRWAWGETSEQYPNKFDPRQIELLENFEKSLNLSFDEYELYPNKLKHIGGLMNPDFIETNKDMFKLLKDPAKEREQYNERLTGFVQFKEQLDSKRAEFNESIIPKFGGSGGEVGRMTRDIISSFSYMKALDNFIVDDTQTPEARELAEKHRADTLDRTCQQIKLSYYDVLKLRDSTERNNYVNALNSSVETFKHNYGNELSEEQNKAVNSGLYSFERDVQHIQTQSRGLSR